MKINNIINTLLVQSLGPEKSEVSGSWSVCIPADGNVQRYATTSLVQAEATLNDWLLAGWPAWIEDNDGRLIHSIGTLSITLN
jgi:hypothetical protein